MSKLRRLGVALPPLGNSSNILLAGNGLLPANVRNLLLKSLENNQDISEIVNCNISEAYIVNGKVYENNICLSDLDLVFWWSVLPTDPNCFEMQILMTLTQTTRVLPSPNEVIKGNDKLKAHSILRNAGIPTADFSLFSADKVNLLAESLQGWGTILLKPTLGNMGHGIHMVKGKQDFIDSVQYAQSFSNQQLSVFCEKFEPNDIKKWISTTIIGGELIYGYRKKPEKFVGGWKVYDAGKHGGCVDYVDPSPVAEVALKSAKILGCDIIGFDFIFSTEQQRYILVDENTMPGMYPKCFEESGKGSWDSNFYRMIIDHL